jgi:hypothetical protein
MAKTVEPSIRQLHRLDGELGGPLRLGKVSGHHRILLRFLPNSVLTDENLRSHLGRLGL